MLTFPGGNIIKAQNITIDINRLSTNQLDQLAAMIHETNAGSARDVQTINNRVAFIEGWMSEKAEAEYFAAYC